MNVAICPFLKSETNKGDFSLFEDTTLEFECAVTAVILIRYITKELVFSSLLGYLASVVHLRKCKYYNSLVPKVWLLCSYYLSPQH